METSAADGLAPTNGSVPATIIQEPTPRELKPVAATRGGPPPALVSAPNAGKLLLALRRRWFLALSVGLLCAPAVAAGVWFLRPITFTARTTLRVSSVPLKI